MKKFHSLDIRNIWLNFFKKHGHHHVKSSSLIPEEDPTLLWINAGITPLKKYFNGFSAVDYTKMVSIQKCLRTNDIENVGKTSIHHTFFEMLGNFSIGDYFKNTAIELACELLFSSECFNIDPKKIYITYYYKDKETFNLWLKKGIKSDHLIPLKANFWHIGKGPCGPCTEIFFDRGIKFNLKGKELLEQEIDNDRFIEIWNIVFSQYQCEKDIIYDNYKNLSFLPSKNIDTGAGLERLACVLQEVEDTFATDLFAGIIKKISFFSKIDYCGQDSFKVIADHIRSLVFAISDGVVFANDGRGYILKKILRKAIQKGKLLNFNEPFLYQLVPTVVEIMKDHYSYLLEYIHIVQKLIYQEEIKFFYILQNAEEKIYFFVKNHFLNGDNFFKLYDTYGIPQEIILEYCQQKKILVDALGFQKQIELNKKLSRSRQIFQPLIINNNNIFFNFTDKSEFIGYHVFEIKTKIIKVFEEGIVLAKTPFYAAKGGQISDEGWIDNVPVIKIVQLYHGQILHQVKGSFYKNQEVIAKINLYKRHLTSMNHTATHLLHDSIKLILGPHVEQKGSFIGPNILRFDFNHYEKISDQNVIKIESQINYWIKKHKEVIIKAMLFKNIQQNTNINYFKNKKYPEHVRLVQIDHFSLALCSGTHVKNTIDLQKFIILSCELISSGIYRIEAITGNNFLPILQNKINFYLAEKQNIIRKASNLEMHDLKLSLPSVPIIKGSYHDIIDYKIFLHSLQQKFKNFKKEIISYQTKYVLKNVAKFIPQTIGPNMILFIHMKMELEVWKFLLEYLFQTLKTEILLLCYQKDDRLFFICKSKTLHAGQLIQKISEIAGGFGGGKENFAQGSSKHLDMYSEIIKYWNQKFL